MFVFSAAFPFFNNVDEQQHVDLVFKYSHGYLPHGLDHFSAESAPYLTLYASPEYFLPPEHYGGKYPPPNWAEDGRMPDSEYQATLDWWQARENQESAEPSLYYSIAGQWLNIGKLLGIKGELLLYWIRFLNVFFAIALVWIGFKTARLVFQDNILPAIGSALLLALWPQTAFYSIQPDALSPVCFGIAFFALIKLLRSQQMSAGLGVQLGLALAAAFLTKTSNLPFLAIAGIVVLAVMWRITKSGGLRKSMPGIVAIAVCAILPILPWLAWNHHIFGDLTGTSAKVELLGWKPKPISEWWSHPIFTLHGFQEFWSQLLASFWRGEFIWHGVRLASPLTDASYWVSSGLIIVLAGFGLIREARRRSFESRVLVVALASFLAGIAFLAVLSVAYDFGDCPYPSREHPYFTSGRLLAGAAIPFFTLYIYAVGLTAPGKRLKQVGLGAFCAVALFVAISQALVNWPAFASPYNFFHL